MKKHWSKVVAGVVMGLILVAGLGACAAPPAPAATPAPTAPPAPKAVLFTDAAVRQTARYQSFGPKGFNDTWHWIPMILVGMPAEAERIEIKAPFRGFRACDVSQRFVTSYLGADGILRDQEMQKGMTFIGFGREQRASIFEYAAYDSNVQFGAKAFAGPCVDKWLEPGETIAVVPRAEFESFYVPVGSEPAPWQKRFALAFWSLDTSAGKKVKEAGASKDAAVNWDPWPDIEAALAKVESYAPTIKK